MEIPQFLVVKITRNLTSYSEFLSRIPQASRPPSDCKLCVSTAPALAAYRVASACVFLPCVRMRKDEARAIAIIPLVWRIWIWVILQLSERRVVWSRNYFLIHPLLPIHSMNRGPFTTAPLLFKYFVTPRYPTSNSKFSPSMQTSPQLQIPVTPSLPATSSKSRLPDDLTPSSDGAFLNDASLEKTVETCGAEAKSISNVLKRRSMR